ncbi:hypothetical protein SAMN05421593_3458 [Chryseobacterium culicis]|jgi:hypothetical protein|uniref:Uncharacterized protein n=1 Tax=Chryseobacterium culicis TaxID=680127 RepID=A0A1H6HQ55_CHRCI|nr:hypothetical protein SAMN05421593_3458 [Chryseobacterium culicis]
MKNEIFIFKLGYTIYYSTSLFLFAAQHKPENLYYLYRKAFR